MNKQEQLVQSCLKWWNENKDTQVDSCRGFDYNLFEEEPEFVSLARDLKIIELCKFIEIAISIKLPYAEDVSVTYDGKKMKVNWTQNNDPKIEAVIEQTIEFIVSGIKEIVDKYKNDQR